MLRPNTTLFLQPVDHGVIAILKACFLLLVLRYLVSESDGEGKPVVQELCKKCNIKIAKSNIVLASDKGTQKNVNGVLRAMVPMFVPD